MTEIYRQGDDRWGQIKVGKTNFNVAGVGCLGTAITQASADRGAEIGGLPITPLLFFMVANEKQLFGSDGMLATSRAGEVVQGLKWIDSINTGVDHRSGRIERPINTAIREIVDYLAKGFIVILQVDASPHNGLIEGDHFVDCLEAINDGEDFKIKDPIFGTETTLNAPTIVGKQVNYGPPKKSIFGYRVFSYSNPSQTTILMDHLNILENTLVTCEEGSGAIGVFAKGSLIIAQSSDEVAKIHHIWMDRNKKNSFFSGGPMVSVTFAEWNKFNHLNLHNEPIV